METTTNEEQNSGQHQEAQEELQPVRVLVPPEEVFKKQQEVEQQYLETIAKMNK